MAIQQVLTVYLNLKGDAAASTFVFALQNLYQFANGIAVPFGGAGVVPTAVSANNPPVPVTSVTVDANGNITLTTTSPLPASVFTFQLDLTFNSGSSTSSSATQTTNVTIVGSSSVTVSGTAAVAGTLTHNNAAPTTNNVGVLPAVASTSAPTYNAGDQVLLSTDLSGNLRVSGSFSSGALVDLVGTTSPLNALNAAATINAFGYESVGMFLAAGTLQGTIIPEASLDGGSTWVATNFLDPLTNATVASYVFASNNTATSASIVTVGGASNYRVRVSAFTSGTANATLRANEVTNNTTIVTQPVAANLNATVVQGTGTNLHTVVDSGTITTITNAVTVSQGTAANLNATVTGTVAATQSGNWSVRTQDGAGNNLTSNSTTQSRSLDVNLVSVLGATMSNTNPSFTSITDGTTKVSVIAGTSALKIDESSQAGTAITTVPVAFGTGTPSGNAPGANVALYVGTTPVRTNQTTTATGAVDVNNVGINGTTIVTAAAGVQKVGIVGNAGATVDAAINTGAAPTNVLWHTAAPSTVAQTALTAKPISPTGIGATSGVLKASAGNLYGLSILSLNTTTTTNGLNYIHFFNTTTTAGLTTGSWQFAIPVNSNAVAGAGVTLSIPPGALALANFSTGITYVCNTTSTSATTASGSGIAGVFWIE